MNAFHEAGAYITGGHTSQASDLQVGFAVTGFKHDKPVYTPKDGDRFNPHQTFRHWPHYGRT